MKNKSLPYYFLALCLVLAGSLPMHSYAQVNLALSATAAHSGGGDAAFGYGANNYNDNLFTPCSGSCASCTAAPWGWVSNGPTQWIEYTWSSPQVFDKVVFYKADRPMSETKLQYWNGAAYVDIMDYKSSICTEDSIIFPPVTSTRLRFYGINGGNPNFREIQVFQKLPPCTGAPVAGTATASATTLCPGASVRLWLSGHAMALGLNYNWDTAATVTGTWGLISTGTMSAISYTPPAGRTLNYRCRVTCIASGLADTSRPVAVSGYSLPAPPYAETFESISTVNELPSCMSATSINPYVQTILGPADNNRKNHTPGGSKYAYFRYGSKDYLLTPALQLTAGKAYRISFWYSTDGNNGWDSLALRAGNAASAAAMTITLGVVDKPKDLVYKEHSAIYTPSATGPMVFGIYCKASTSPMYLCLDDISIQELPPCSSKPVAGTAVSLPERICNSGSPVLSLSGTSLVSGLNYVWQSSATGAAGSYTAIPGGISAIFTAPAISAATYYRALVICTATSDTSISTPVYVPAGPQTVPYSETFESISRNNEFPVCMSATSIAPMVYTFIAPGANNRSNHTPGGSKYACFRWNSNDYLFTPALQLTAGKTYRCSFWYITDGLDGWDSLGVKVGTAATAAAMTTTLGTISGLKNVVYQEYAVNYTATITGPVYFGIYCKAAGPPVYLSVDDINIQELLPCSGKPVAGTAAATPARICNSGSPELSLSGTSIVSGLSYLWQSSTTGAPGSYTTIPGSTTAVFTAPAISTTTYYRALVICAATSDTAISTPVSVPVGPQEPPYLETFESITREDQLPLCMSATRIADFVFTFLAPDDYNRSNHTPGGSKYACFLYNSNDYLFSPALQLTAGKAYRFSFWYITDGYNGWDSLGVKVGTAATAAAMTTTLGMLSGLKNTSYKEYSVVYIPATTGPMYFGIYCKANNIPYYLSIDDIGLQQLPPCSGKPVAGTAAAAPVRICNTGSPVLRLSGTSAASDLSYIWQSSATGAPGSFSTIPGGTTAVFTAPAISSATYYRALVICPFTSDTSISTVVYVQAGPYDLPYLETFENIERNNQLPLCMSATSIAPKVYTYLTATGSNNQKNHTTGGAKFASFGNNSTDYLFTPGFRLTAGKTYRFSFWYISDGRAGWDSLSAKMGTAASAAAMTTTLGNVLKIWDTEYQEFSTTFVATASDIYYIGIYCKSGSIPNYLSLDDIGLQELPPCSGIALTGTVSAMPERICGTGSTTLSLKGTSPVAGLTYSWESSTTGTPGTFTPIPGGSTGVFTAPPVAVSTYYRAVISCTATRDTAISAALYVPAGYVIPPYSETFEGIRLDNQLPPCMSTTSLAPMVYTFTTGTTAPRMNHTPGGSKFAAFRYNANDYLFTPGIQLTAGQSYELSFWYVTDGVFGWNTLSARMGTAPTAAAMTTTLGSEIRKPVNKVYQQFKARFIATGGVQYIGIYCNAIGIPSYLSIDDIELQPLPPCSGKPVTGIPKATASELCDAGTTTLELPGLTPASGFAFSWQDSVAGGSWGSGGGRPSTGGISIPFTTGVVTQNTWFRCLVTCIATGDTTMSPAVRVNAGPKELPYQETFEGITAANYFPDCMTATNIYTYTYTMLAGASGNRSNHTTGGSKYAYFYSGSNDSILTPTLTLRTGYQYTLSFWYISDGRVGWEMLSGILSGMGTATTLKPVFSTRTTTYTRYIDTFTVKHSGSYKLGIYCKAVNPALYLSVDDIGVQALPCSGTPDAGIIRGSIAPGTPACPGTRISLYATGATMNFVPGISYQWQRSPVGRGSWSDIAGATDTLYLSDTTIGWDYRFRVSCAVSGLSAHTPVFSVPLAPLHPAVQILGARDSILFCNGDTVKLRATPYPGAVYTWKRNGELIPGWTFSDLSTTDSGRYTVEVSSPVSPCPAYSETVRLIGNDPGFTAGLSTPADSFLCDGESVILNGTTSKTGLNLQWQHNSLDIPGATGLSYTARETGYYRLKADDGSGCAALSRTIRILVKPVPEAIISAASPTFTACDNEGLLLKATNTGYAYQWSRNGRPVAGMTDSNIIATLPGVYTVKITNADGCATVSEGVTVTLLPSPVVSISRSGLLLTAVTGPFKTHQWYRNGSILPGSISGSLTLTHNGRYKVVITADNDCPASSETLDINETGLSIDPATLQQARIFPNPASQSVMLEVPVPFTVTVKDVTGRILQEANDVPFINVAHYSDGIYLFIIHDKEGKLLLTQRISKQSGQ